jgi:heat shock protein HtpX
MGSLKTLLLLSVLTALFGVIGQMLGGTTGMLMALGFAAATNVWAYWNSDKMVLRMHGAVLVDQASAPQFYQIVAEQAARAGLPMPKIYIMETDQPNAFATGRNPQNAAVAATRGILRILTPDELAGVIAHELGHVKNRDTLTMTIVATLAGALATLANYAGMFAYSRRDGRRNNPLLMLVAVIVAPLAAMLIRMAISRTREFEADRCGAETSGQPEALASALNKIANGAARLPNITAEQNPATAHLFIMNPLHMKSINGLFATHPDTTERIERLMKMAAHQPNGPHDHQHDPFAPKSDTFAPDETNFKNPWDSAA